MVAPLVPALIAALPTVASWIFGDKSGKAVETVSNIALEVLGTTDGTAIEKALASDPAKALEFKMAVLKAEGEARAAEHEELVARIADVQSARTQTVELARIGSPLAWGAAMVSIVVLVTFGYVLNMVLTKTIPEGQEHVVMYMLGALTTMAVAVVGYWVGSTAGSMQKTMLLNPKR